VLRRLGHLVGETRYLSAAQDTLVLASEQMRRVPYAHASLLAALEEYLNLPETLVIRGEGDDMEHWFKTASRFYAPRRLVLAIPSDEDGLPGTLAAMRPGSTTRLYRCVGTRCEPPIEDVAELERALLLP